MNFAGPIDAKFLGDSPVAPEGGSFAFAARPGFVQHNPSDAHVVVPDAHLLFSGNYTRIGNDLIISGGDQKFVVGNYFKGESRPALTSKDGATLSGQIVDTLTGHVHYAQAGAAAVPAQVIGHVMKLSGSANVIRNGVSVELHVGDAVQKGDVVQTGSESSVGMTFIDGSAFGMTSNARMVLNEMIYDPNGSSNSSLISLVQGTITFVAGQTAKNGNMRVETPVATMGIRGTAVLVEISANDGPTKFSVLVEPDGKTGSFNLYDKTSGQLIGTVSQAGQVTFVSSLGIGQPPSAIEQLKTLQDQQNEKLIVQQVFQLYFPNYTPDDARPKSPNGNPRTDIGVPENSIGKYAVDPGTGRPTYTVITPITNPDTHQTTNTQVTFYNIKAVFSATGLSAKEESPGDQSASGIVKLTDAVHIDDPDIGNEPFFDVATKFVAYSGLLTSATTTADLTSAAKAALNLDSLLTIDQTTGDVSFNRADFNFLAAGEKAEFVIRVTASSGPDSAQVFVKITIDGENDAPTIVTSSTVATGGVTEDDVPLTDNLSASGAIGFQDLDLTDAHTAAFVLKSAVSSAHLPGFVDGAVGVVNGVTGIGSFSLGAVSEILTDATDTGQVAWNFVLPDNDPVLQSLAVGQTIKQIYTVTITDGSGVSVVKDVEITLTGTNDVPTITSGAVQADTIYEIENQTGGTGFDHNAGGNTPAGSILFADVDLIDRPAATTASQTIVYKSADGLVDLTSTLTPAQLVAIKGAFALAQSGNTNNGVVNWTYKLPDNVLDFMSNNETIVLVSTVEISDQNGGTAAATVTINIIGGANDVPSITSATGLALTEADVALQDTITVNFTDVDLTETGHTASVVNVAMTGAIPPGTTQGQVFTSANAFLSLLTVGAVVKASGSSTGSATFNFAATPGVFDYLAVGEIVTLTYMIAVTDSSLTSDTRTVTVTITGTNDVPVINAIGATALTEQTNTNALTLVSPINVAFTDVDLTDVGHTASITSVTTAGVTTGLSLTSAQLISLVTASTVTKAAGSSTGSVDLGFSAASTAFDYLAAGQILTLTYTIAINDGDGGIAPQTFKITITGTNDAPVINAIGATALTEQTNTNALTLVSPIQVTFTDVDLSDVGHTASITAVVATGATAGLALDATALKALVTPGMVAKASGSSSGSVDLGFSAPSTAFDYLAAGQTITLTYTVAINDGDGGIATKTFDITITGTNDAPAVAPVTTATLVDTSAPDTFATQTGTLVGTDVDNGETAGLTYAALNGSIYVNTAVAGSYGALTVNADGTYSYVANAAAINALNAGSYVDTFTVQTKDTHGATGTATFTVNVTGANDSPTVAGALTLTTSEGNGPVIKNLLEGASDADTGDTLSVANLKIDGVAVAVGASLGGIVVFPDAGTFKISVDGANPAFDHIAAGATQTILVSYDVTDSHGATVAQTETITITGTNDRPVLGAGQNLTTITEDQTANSGQLVSSFATGITDVDDGAVKGIAVTGFAGGNGQWQYSLDGGTNWANLAAFSAGTGLLLAMDDKVRFVPDGQDGGTKTLTYVAWDQTSGTHGQTVNTPSGLSDAFSQGSQTATLTVTPVNDAPVLNANNVSTQELGNGVTKVMGVTLSDVDAGADTFTVTASAEHGTVSTDGTVSTVGNQSLEGAGISGTFAALTGIFNDGAIYTPTNASPTDKVTLTVTDGQGGSDTLNFIFKQFAPGGVTLTGTPGKDWILSSTGDDTMTGGAGADNFVFAPSSRQDVITDFAQGVDRIDLNLSGGPDTSTIVSWLQTAAQVVGTDTLLKLNGDIDTVLVKGVTALNANDFILHA